MRKFKVLSVLLVCILVSLLVAVISRKIADEELTRSAYQEAESENKRYITVANALFMSVDWVTNSFLSAYMDVSWSEENDSSVHILSSDNFGTISSDELYDDMQSFLSYNTTLYSCILTFVPGIVKDAPDGISAAMYSGNSKRFNLLEEEDIFGKTFYRQVAESERYTVKDGVVKDSILVWTLGMPIFDEHGTLVGECWVDMLEDTLSQQLHFYEPDKTFISCIINDNYRIVASSDKSLNGTLMYDYEPQKARDFSFKEWCGQVTDIVEGDGSGWFLSKFGGKTMITSISKIKYTDYHLVSIRKGGSIDRAVDKILRHLMTVSGIGLLLLAIALTYLFAVFRKQEAKDRQISSELDIASRIQRSILPTNIGTQGSPVNVYGFQRPAKSVGGDLYDYFLKGKKLHFCIGDVSGKGVPASLMMTELCSLYRFIAKKTDDVKEIVETLNSAVMEHNDDSMMCTLFVGVLDTSSGRLDWCNAGHNPPVLIPASSAVPEYMVTKANMPICAFEDYGYKPGSMNLEHGDRLFLYTDGVTESCNSHQQFLGKEATLDILRRHRKEDLPQLVESVLIDIEAFMQKAEQNDDITILCIEYENQS